MANAKKCDVCGKLYEFNAVGRPILDDLYLTNIFVNFKDELGEYEKALELDLCDYCSRKVFQEVFLDEELNVEED